MSPNSSSGTSMVHAPPGEKGNSPLTFPSEELNDTQVTCDVLCSLSATYTHPGPAISKGGPISVANKFKVKPASKSNHQLPMFLSKTYHMIDRCDPIIATWSQTGDNFVVKNLEQFSSEVLPLYFKHSNFSSFARQLNFYGFRKLRSDPILTSDVDPRTASYVRFYHNKFQKDRPDLLHEIKRATKSDQQSKDEVEALKLEVSKLKECIGGMNQQINTLTTNYEKLATLLTDIVRYQAREDAPGESASESQSPNQIGSMYSLSQVAAMSLQRQLESSHTSEATAVGTKRQIPGEDQNPNSRLRIA